MFHQSDLSPHALNYSTPHKSTATTYSYIPYIYRFIISPVFFQPVFFVFHFPSQDWKLRKTLGDSLGPVPRPNWAPAPGGSRSHILVLSHGHVFQKKKENFVPFSSTTADLVQFSHSNSYWSVIDEQWIKMSQHGIKPTAKKLLMNFRVLFPTPPICFLL